MRRRWNRQTYKPPSASEGRMLHVSPLQVRPLAEIIRRQNERKELWEGVAGEVKQAIERINKAGAALKSKDDPGIPRLGAGLSIQQTFEQYEKLQNFLFRVSLDGDALSRGSALSQANALLELNEDIFIDIARNPGNYGLNSPSELVAIIVRDTFVEAVLGRPAPTQHFMSASDGKGKGAGEAEKIAQDQRDALFSTRMPVPKPYVVMQPLINQMLDQLACTSPAGIAAMDGKSGR